MNGRSPDPARLLGFDDPTPGSIRARQVGFVVLFALSLLAVLLFVDLSPEVDRTLFFASDDPELREHQRIREIFPTPPQIIISAGPDGDTADAGGGQGGQFSSEYVSRVADLSRDLRGMDDVVSVRDILHGPDEIEDAFERPMWRRLLVAEDGSATNLIVVLGTDEFEGAVSRLEEILERHRAPGFQLAVSGEPFVVEQLRRQVVEDLAVFGLAALVVFALTMTLLYRSAWIVGGTVVAGGTAVALTMLLRALLGLQVDLLTPNITTIVFVLTLLHVIFMTTNWSVAAGERSGTGDGARPAPEAANGSDGGGDGEDGRRRAERGEGAGDGLVPTAIRWTLPPSFWAMVTTGLGFASLMLAPAQPARNLGISGVIGAVLALVCAYVLYPAYLHAARPDSHLFPGLDRRLSRFFQRTHGWVTVAVGLLVLVAVVGVLRLDTDPDLFAYFGDDEGVRSGLERIDRAGGSSPLDLVFHDAEGAELDDGDVFDRMWALQQEIEADTAVGSVLSLPVLMAEAEEEATLSFLLSWDFLLDRLEDPEHDRIASTFVTEDRRFGRFLLRMKESARGEEESRREVIERLEGSMRNHGFEPHLTGGLYALQAKMSELVSSSLLTGLLGLTGLFTVVAFVVARSAVVGGAMVLSFVAIPALLLGAFGLFGVPLDVIALPAANLAMAIGVDDMVHLVFRVRREDGGTPSWTDWVRGREDLWRAIVNSSLVVTLGFGLLLLSGFPPTRRLGLAVVIGTLVAVVVVLVVFPGLAVLTRADGEAEAATPAEAEK